MYRCTVRIYRNVCTLQKCYVNGQVMSSSSFVPNLQEIEVAHGWEDDGGSRRMRCKLYLIAFIAPYGVGGSASGFLWPRIEGCDRGTQTADINRIFDRLIFIAWFVQPLGLINSSYMIIRNR